MFSIFPDEIKKAFSNIDINKIYEIRLRINKPIMLNQLGKMCYLSYKGQTNNYSESIIISKEDIEKIFYSICENSVYAINDKLKHGFITIPGGARVGVCGEIVYDKNEILTIKNFSSLNVRIPNEQLGCADKLYKYVYDKCFFNTLIVSPPAYGKTTLLKDLIRKVDKFNGVPTLVIDERGEFFNLKCENIDIINYSNKEYAFNCGIRSLAPELIVADELSSKVDWRCVKNASNSGVKIVATCHGASLNDVVNKKNFISNIFERYVILQHGGQPGVIDTVYDKDYKIL